MAQMHGKNVSIYIEDSTGACQSISGKGNNVTFTESVNNPEMLGFGDPAMQRAASGIPDSRVTYEAWADNASGKNMLVLGAIKGKIGNVQLGFAGSATSALKLSACMIMDDYEIGAPVAGIITARANFSLASGSVTSSCWV